MVVMIATVMIEVLVSLMATHAFIIVPHPKEQRL
jgi:hypothetical protein